MKGFLLTSLELLHPFLVLYFICKMISVKNLQQYKQHLHSLYPCFREEDWKTDLFCQLGGRKT